MVKNIRRGLAVGAFALAGFGLSAPAQAIETIWLDSDHSSYSGYYAVGTSLGFAGGGVDVIASGWSIHSDGNVYQAQLGVWNYGLGVLNGSGDNSHTIDNSGYLDFITLQFEQIVTLESARLWTGWHDMNDTDATIGYSNSAIPFGGDLGLAGTSQAALPFTLFESGSYGNSGDSYRNINPGGNSGNLWLIGASFDNPEGNRKLDGFKLEKLKFTVVPEPGTWAMMLLGFGLVGGALRLNRRKAGTSLLPA